jgi:hypothetical protein
VIAAGEGPSRGTHDVRGVERLFVVGDVQSNYEPLALLLEAAGFLGWTGGVPRWLAGNAVLLFLGDLLDGGTQPAEVLWLVYTLAGLARDAGGRVLLLQGNHEQMLLGTLVEDRTHQAMQWFSNDGLETLARLAHARGRSVSGAIQAAVFTPRFSDVAGEAEVRDLVAFVRRAYAPELAFIAREARAAALINGEILAVHGAPNFAAVSWESFAVSSADDTRIAWARDWIDGWRQGGENTRLVTALRELKARLDNTREGIAVRHVVFAHTVLPDLALTAFRGKQCRIARVTPPRDDVPAAYSVMTLPRGVPFAGALGGLEFGREGIVAVYSNEIDDGTQRWEAREVLEGVAG